MLRKLGIFERALYLSDLHAPFNVVSVLQLENAPAPEIVHSALAMLLVRHPLLRSTIKDGWFVEHSLPQINFRVLDRVGEAQWLEIVEQEMNTRLEPDAGLIRAIYILKSGQGELVLTLHHAIVDAASGMNLLDELLKACVLPIELPALSIIPPLEERFPHKFKGLRGVVATLIYATAQLGDELSYWWHVRGKRIPPLRLGGRGFAATLTFSEDQVSELSQRSRKEKITLNSLFNAALVLAVNRHLYEGKHTPLRTFTFADLRPYCNPPTQSVNLANYISMMRLTQEVSGEDQVWDLAKVLHRKIYTSLKRGDKFIAARMSEPLMKIFLGLRTMRMGSVGLNYSGNVPLQPVYGDIKVMGLHAFLSSYDIGPEVSSQARLFNHALWWDFMFLDSDMGRDLAEKILNEVTNILTEACRAPVG